MQDASKLLFAIFIALLFPKSGIDGNRFSFLVDWHDNEASLVRKFNLFYFPSDDAIELIELKNRRTFLKKIKCEGITFKSLYLGSFINVFSRQMKVVDYGDAFTRDYFSSQTERTFALMKPESLKHLGNIVEEIYSRGFEITKAKMCLLSEAQAKEFYKEHEGKSFFLTLVRHMSSEPVLAMELMGKDAIKAWRREIGPTDVEEAKKEAPSSLRSLFGIDKTQNGFHGSDSLESAQRELQIFFPSDTSMGKKAPRTSATFVNCTCCIIKPHAVKEGNLGKILSAIQNSSFQITALGMFYVEHTDAEDFYEVYKGVVPEYNGMVRELMSGPSVALEIKDMSPYSKEDVVNRFRNIVGPSDPEIARELRPNSIRAKFGHTKVKNAIHCTDLPEDGLLEVEYFFKILE